MFSIYPILTTFLELSYLSILFCLSILSCSSCASSLSWKPY